jgi:hypothetical protein
MLGAAMLRAPFPASAEIACAGNVCWHVTERHAYPTDAKVVIHEIAGDRGQEKYEWREYEGANIGAKESGLSGEHSCLLNTKRGGFAGLFCLCAYSRTSASCFRECGASKSAKPSDRAPPSMTNGPLHMQPSRLLDRFARWPGP